MGFAGGRASGQIKPGRSDGGGRGDQLRVNSNSNNLEGRDDGWDVQFGDEEGRRPA